MKILTIIFPEYKDFKVNVDEDAVLMYPETETTPAKQLEIVTTWLTEKKEQGLELLTIVSVSPYVIECAIKRIGKDFNVTYSDGKDIFIEATPIFKLLAQPMKDMFIM